MVKNNSLHTTTPAVAHHLCPCHLIRQRQLAMASAAATGGGSGDVIAKHNACTRKKPNVLVTGTPGSGKTTLCEALRDNVGFKVLNVGQLVREQRGKHAAC